VGGVKVPIDFGCAQVMVNMPPKFPRSGVSPQLTAALRESPCFFQLRFDVGEISEMSAAAFRQLLRPPYAHPEDAIGETISALRLR